jgi:flavin reductase (DIM6/NTAB) family NADH-FMN oxidoreductase RutF
MRNVAAPVSVVTTFVDGQPRGVTVSAFDSLSMQPPMMTVALQDTSSLLNDITVGLALGINVLRSDQENLATRFATHGEDRFAGLDWTMDLGAPRLRHVHAWFGVRVREAVRGGDHVVLVCDVLSAAQGGGRPLTYHDRMFGSHRPN